MLRAPYGLGTWVAVKYGAANPSHVRSAVGWLFEVLFLVMLGVVFFAWIFDLWRFKPKPPPGWYPAGWSPDPADPVEMAAGAGDAAAIFVLGHRSKQQGDLVQAEHWYRTAADAGDDKAMLGLALLFERQGDLVQAEHWYWKAADAGDIPSRSHAEGLRRRRLENG